MKTSCCIDSRPIYSILVSLCSYLISFIPVPNVSHPSPFPGTLGLLSLLCGLPPPHIKKRKIIIAMSVTEPELTGTKYSYTLSCGLQALCCAHFVKIIFCTYDPLSAWNTVHIITITISLLDKAFDKIQSSYVSLNVRSLNRYFIINCYMGTV